MLSEPLKFETDTFAIMPHKGRWLFFSNPNVFNENCFTIRRLPWQS